jgi:histidinol-phosphate/aromatic aminotransferase/cobyric acid decarboxylase-like protein
MAGKLSCQSASAGTVRYSAIADQLEGVKVVYLCSPNNPTGNLINQDDIRQLLAVSVACGQNSI